MYLIAGVDPRPPLNSAEEAAVEKAMQGKKITAWDKNRIAKAVEKGWLIDDGDGKYSIAPHRAALGY
jgi:hypothetical protein